MAGFFIFEMKTRIHNKLPVLHLQKDIDELFAGRKSLARSGKQTSTISSLYLLRNAIQEDEPFLFLFHVQKRVVPKAHERNKLRRWMREAVRQSEELHEIKSVLQ